MEICSVNKISGIKIEINTDIKHDNIGQANKQQVQQQNQVLPEIQNTVEVSTEQINKAVEQANKSLAVHSTKLNFTIHDKTKEIMVKVVDTNTGEVIREIPPEKFMDRLAMVLEEIGLLVDETV